MDAAIAVDIFRSFANFRRYFEKSILLPETANLLELDGLSTEELGQIERAIRQYRKPLGHIGHSYKVLAAEYKKRGDNEKANFNRARYQKFANASAFCEVLSHRVEAEMAGRGL